MDLRRTTIIKSIPYLGFCFFILVSVIGCKKAIENNIATNTTNDLSAIIKNLNDSKSCPIIFL